MHSAVTVAVIILVALVAVALYAATRRAPPPRAREAPEEAVVDNNVLSPDVLRFESMLRARAPADADAAVRLYRLYDTFEVYSDVDAVAETRRLTAAPAVAERMLDFEVQKTLDAPSVSAVVRPMPPPPDRPKYAAVPGGTRRARVRHAKPRRYKWPTNAVASAAARQPRDTGATVSEKADNLAFAEMPHNSHDSGINMSTRASIRRLKDHTENHRLNRTETLRQLRAIMGQNHETLQQIEDNSVGISTFGGMVEADILALVWSRINHPENAGRVDSLVEILESQLDDAAGVCAVGRVNRVMSTLVGADARPGVCEAVPTHSIVNSLRAKVAQTIQEERDKLDDSDYDDARALAASVDSTVARLEKLKAEYGDVLPPTKIARIVDPSIDVLRSDL